MLRCLALVSLYFLFVCFIYLFIHADKETNKCVDFFVDFFFFYIFVIVKKYHNVASYIVPVLSENVLSETYFVTKY